MYSADSVFDGQMVGYAVAYIDLESAIATPPRDRTWGHVAWASVFDDVDLAELRDEWTLLLLECQVTRSTARMVDEIASWRTTARLLSDPVARALLADNAPPDCFVEVLRPVGDTDSDLY